MGCINFEEGQIVLNLEQAGALANWKNYKEENWSFHSLPEDKNDKDHFDRKFLHAKYILFYNRIDGRGNNCNRGVLYIGSGNLSKCGLLNNKNKLDNNIECGVLLDVNNVSHIKRNLFVGKEIYEVESGDHDPSENIDKNQQCPFCPVLALQVLENDTKIIWCENLENGVKVIINTSNSDSGTEYISPNDLIASTQFKEMHIVNYNNNEYLVPIISKNGLIAEKELKTLSFHDALDYLESFKNKQEENSEDFSLEDDDDLIESESLNKSLNTSNVKKYPMHTAATLVETIACINKSFDVESQMLPNWLNALENNFTKIFNKNDVEQWKVLKLNFLQYLKEEPFAIPQGKYSTKYIEIIDKIINEWSQ
jgi:hypothetical protein